MQVPRPRALYAIRVCKAKQTFLPHNSKPGPLAQKLGPGAQSPPCQGRRFPRLQPGSCYLPAHICAHYKPNNCALPRARLEVRWRLRPAQDPHHLPLPKPWGHPGPEATAGRCTAARRGARCVARPCARPARRRSPVGLALRWPARGLRSRRRRSAPRGPRPPKAGSRGGGEPGSQRRGPGEATLGSRGAWRAAAGSLTTVRRGSAPGVRDRARRSLRALPERVPAELSEPLSSEITMKSSMATGPPEPRASGQRPRRLRLRFQQLKRLQRPRRRHPG